MSKRQWLILGMALALLWGFGLRKLRFSGEVLDLLPPGLPSARAITEYEKHFGNANEWIIGLEGLTPEGLEQAARELGERLRGERDLFRDVFWTPPWLEHPGELAELVAYLWVNGDSAGLAGLEERLGGGALTARLEHVREQLMASFSPGELARLGNDPLGLLDMGSGLDGMGADGPEGAGVFVNRAGTFRVLLAQPAGEMSGHRAAQVWHAAAQRVVEGWLAGREEGARPMVHLTGRPAFVAEISGQLRGDLTRSTLGTAVLVGLLFWWAHREFRTLLWLLALLVLTAGTTLALAGLAHGEMNLISVGFGGILLGLVVDYALILHQEGLEGGGGKGAAARVGGGIFAAAATTAGAFGLLNFSGLPGLSQLGSMVALGVLVGAWIMLRLFPLGPSSSGGVVREGRVGAAGGGSGSGSGRAAMVATVALALGGVAALWFHPTRMDTSAEPLRPSRSRAHEAMGAIQRGMGEGRDGLWVVAGARSFEETGKVLESLSARLEDAKREGGVESMLLPTAIWPRPSRQAVNLDRLPGLVEALKNAERRALAAGFSTESLGLSKRVAETWGEWLADVKTPAEAPRLPKNRTGVWMLGRFMAVDDSGVRALGLIRPTPGVKPAGSVWLEEARGLGAAVGGWELLGGEVFGVVRGRVGPLMAGLVLIVVVCLLGALRSAKAVLVCMGSAGLAFLSLNACMGYLGWSWNLMSLLALPVLLGTGLDFSLHMSLGLRRHGGDAGRARATVGRAVGLCAATTVIGFGSLAWTHSAGLSSLGKVCALGVVWNAVVAIGLLPRWSRSMWHTSTKSDQ